MSTERREAIIFLMSCFVCSASFGEDTAKEVASYLEVVRAQIAEGINYAGGVQAAVTEFYQAHGRFPVDNAEAGLIPPFEIKGQYVVAVTVTSDSGKILVEFGALADPVISGRSIEMSPAKSGSKINWTCSSRYISTQYLPAECQ